MSQKVLISFRLLFLESDAWWVLSVSFSTRFFMQMFFLDYPWLNRILLNTWQFQKFCISSMDFIRTVLISKQNHSFYQHVTLENMLIILWSSHVEKKVVILTWQCLRDYFPTRIASTVFSDLRNALNYLLAFVLWYLASLIRWTSAESSNLWL